MWPVDGRIFGSQQWRYPANVRIDIFCDIGVSAGSQKNGQDKYQSIHFHGVISLKVPDINSLNTNILS
jgi:hypothetical protein